MQRVSLLERGRINITVNTAHQTAHILEISLSEVVPGAELTQADRATKALHRARIAWAHLDGSRYFVQMSCLRVDDYSFLDRT
jgi:hypothetical protein